MRFFTNDRDTADRDDHDDDSEAPERVGTEEQPDHVASAPVPVPPVPQQRPASPWAEGPRQGEDSVEEQARAEDLTGVQQALAGDARSGPDDARADRGPFDDPVVDGDARRTVDEGRAGDERRAGDE